MLAVVVTAVAVLFAAAFAVPPTSALALGVAVGLVWSWSHVEDHPRDR